MKHLLAISIAFIAAFGCCRADNVVLQSQTYQPLEFNMVESADHITPLTGASPTVVISKNGGSFGAPSGTVSEIGDGWYAIAGNATDEATLGKLVIHATATGGDPADTAYLVVAYNPLSATNLGLSAVPTASPNTSGGFLTYGSSTGQLNPTSGTFTGVGLAATQPGVTIPTVTTVTNQVAANVTDILGHAPTLDAANQLEVDTYWIEAQDATATGSVAFPSSIGTSTFSGGAVASVTEGVTVATNDDKTGYSLTQAFPSYFADMAITSRGVVTASVIGAR